MSKKVQVLRTAGVELTDPDENVEDLASLLAIVAFTSGFTETEIKEYMTEVIEDQYFQSVMRSGIKKD